LKENSLQYNFPYPQIYPDNIKDLKLGAEQITLEAYNKKG
jgi:hypothetical protein